MIQSNRKKIVLSQRVEEVPSYKERRDCLDQQWFVLLEQLNLQPFPAPNSMANIQDWLNQLNPDGIILTGGNNLAHIKVAQNTAPERDETEKAMLDYALDKKLPVLGVCRGLQMMNVYLGGNLIPLKGHTAVRHVVESINNDSLFNSYKNVNSFHDWGIDKSVLSQELVPLVYTSGEDSIEAVRHRNQPWTGIMWHPEREHPYSANDYALISNIFNSQS